MARRFRWFFVALAGLSFWYAGVWLFAEPDDEVLYAGSAPIQSCVSSGCIYIYRVTVGNTGARPQPNVYVRLRADVLDSAILKPKVQTFGVRDRDIRISDEQNVRTFTLGAMKPRERVEISWTLQLPAGEAAPSWDSVVLGVQADQGEVLRGDPASVTLARVLWSVFGHLPL